MWKISRLKTQNIAERESSKVYYIYWPEYPIQSKMSIFPEFIYKFKEISIKISAGIFGESNKLILNYI